MALRCNLLAEAHDVLAEQPDVVIDPAQALQKALEMIAEKKNQQRPVK